MTNEEIKKCAIEAGFQFKDNEIVLYDDGDKLLLRPNYAGTLTDGLKDFAKAIEAKVRGDN